MSRAASRPAWAALAAALAAAVALSQDAPSGERVPEGGLAPSPPSADASHGGRHGPPLAGPAVIHPDERHLRSLRQLTFDGQNAEGYWSPDGTRLIYQHMDEDEGLMCDQEFVLDFSSGKSRRVSTGKGRVTCGYFFAGGKRIFYPRPTSPAGQPPGPRPPEGVRLASSPATNLHGRRRRQQLRAAHHDARLRRRGHASRPTERGSSSRRYATATSRSTRCASTAAT